MMDDFAVCLAHVLHVEGGYSDNPRDPGGATNEGITQHVYDNWRLSAGLQTRDVRLLGQAEAEAIYRKLYWNAVRGDQLPAGVDYCVFDFAVNSGAHEASKCLQTAAGVTPDGFIGAVTINAVRAADPRRIINGVCAERLAYMETLRTWPTFHNGWSARVAEVEQVARGMVA
jgi:lysozyme family protein